jgi:hypothetical protein
VVNLFTRSRVFLTALLPHFPDAWRAFWREQVAVDAVKAAYEDENPPEKEGGFF